MKMYIPDGVCKFYKVFLLSSVKIHKRG